MGSQTSVKKLIEKLNDELGEGTIHSGDEIPNIRKMPFSVPMANYVSFGGLHMGRLNEFVGSFSSLKSYLAYDQIAKFQRYDWANNEMNAFTGLSIDKSGKITPRLRKGYSPKKKPVAKRVCLCDVEGTYTRDWGERVFGIDNDSLIRLQPDSPASAINVCAALLSEDEICLVVYDSASIVEMDDEWNKSMEEATMGSNTRFWSRSARKMIRAMNSNPGHGDATFILVNSIYSKVGMVMGNPEVIRNGEQLKLAKSLSLHLRGLAELKEAGSEESLGRNVWIKCLKNKAGAMGRTGTFFYAYTDTEEADSNMTDVVGQYVDLAVKFEIVAKGGNVYHFEGLKVKGFEAFTARVREDAEVFNRVRVRVDKEVICIK